MQIHRLFEMVYLLMERGGMTAGELSERFEVSVRTVYRDVETLSEAGIPIYANRGNGGGIRLMDDFVLSRSLLSEREQNDILASLQGLSAIRMPDVDTALTKLAALFGKSRASWIDVDFSGWSSGREEREKFLLLRNAVLQKQVVSFDYFGANGEMSHRTAEPLKILFKGAGWYLYAFCRMRRGCRVFKITRIRGLSQTGEQFEREIPESVFPESVAAPEAEMVPLKLRLDASLAFRVMDEFPPETVRRNTDGSFTASLQFPKGEWLYGFLLSFGSQAEVLEPPEVRRQVAQILREMGKHYPEYDV